MLYICKCGKAFDKPQSYNAHLSNCRVNLGDEKYLARLTKNKINLAKGSKRRAELQLQKTEEKYQKEKLEWESTTHYCERCGKKLPHNYEDRYATGRFCSKSCANARDHSEETLRKIALNSDPLTRSGKMSINGHYKGYYCASSYELVFLVYCLDHNIKIERNKFTFDYEYEGKTHIYIPDWYLPEIDMIIECKGMTSSYDDKVVQIKAQSVVGHNYKLLFEKDLKEYWDYCKEVYNVKSYKALCRKLYEEDWCKEDVKPSKKEHWNVGENNPSYGRHWYTDGVNNLYTYECPEGFHKGRTI